MRFEIKPIAAELFLLGLAGVQGPIEVGTSCRTRYALRISGTVQGVGFRPAMFRLATRLGLGGFVRNDLGGVRVEIEGGENDVERFVALLPDVAPPSARIEAIEKERVRPEGAHVFGIVESDLDPRSLSSLSLAWSVPADLAPCAACLAEAADPKNRRFRHAFISCTACGPRFTIVKHAPYDRAATSMARFLLCEDCRREYEDPNDRRFHAETIACPLCGPTLSLWIDGRETARGDEALLGAAAMIDKGAIVAVKGMGGFVLAADATNAPAVARLRERKRRPHRPLAVMVRSLEVARELAAIDARAAELLESSARPIVLLPLAEQHPLAPNIAPGLIEVGVFLPPTPLQALLAEQGPRMLVMTSGNLASEPMITDDVRALEAFADVADAILLHDRAIEAHADDSVLRMSAGVPRTIRRARGFVPEPFAIGSLSRAPFVLAVGGHARNTVCALKGGRVLLSQHIGDLGSAKTFEVFEKTIARMLERLGGAPELVAHDLHPDYRSTIWAKSSGLSCTGVQHHHAHVAACMAEHQRFEAMFGVVFDGTGFGDDGSLWGGELLAVDRDCAKRLAHLRPLALPGGEAAIKEPWRCAVSALVDAGEDLSLLEQPARFGEARLASMRKLIERATFTVPASGAGRWFDAVSALLGVRDVVSYDGQAAIELEAIAAPGPCVAYPFAIEREEIDLRPMIRAIAEDLRRGLDRGVIAARFHETLSTATVAALLELDLPRHPIVLTGGCFQNRRLAERTRALFEDAGYEVLMPHRVPANDGGIALGQAVIAAMRERS